MFRWFYVWLEQGDFEGAEPTHETRNQVENAGEL
jgi:hypothetical protein